MSAADHRDARTRSRQNIILLTLALVLLLGGLVVLLYLQRMPLPMRLVVSLGDFAAATALLLLLYQRAVRP